MNRSSTLKKLFLTLFLLGISNIVLAYVFFYYTSITLLKERSSQQMSAVRVQASQKLTLYLDSLKTFALQKSQEIENKGAVALNGHAENVSGLYVFSKNKKLKRLAGKPIDQEFVKKIESSSFYPYHADELIIKVPVKSHFIVWVFEGKGFNKLLEEKEGLGQSGEIYLVGNDNRIRSASRHVKDWKGMYIDNESILLGKTQKMGVHKVKDYRGVEVVSAYSPFVYDHLNFVLLSEIDQDEVLSPLRSLFPKILALCCLFCCVTFLFAYISTGEIIRLIDHMREQINNFHIKFINSMEEEKKKMSYNLHDGVGQILTALKWGISQNQDEKKLKDLCDEAFKEIRSISNNLMPAVLIESGFFSAIKEYLLRLEEFYKIHSTYRYSDMLGKYEFKEGMDVNLYRMIQELLHNTLKHAKASSVSVVMIKEENNFILRYEDDGVGMPDTEPMPKVLLYRSDLMGAAIKRSKISPGLVYEVKVPMKRLFNE